MKQRLSIKQRQYGVNLVEIMIALTLGLFLMLGASTMFFSNKRIYREIEQMRHLQDSARVAMDIITEDIRMVGFVGCHFNANNVTNLIINSSTTIGKPNNELYDYRFFIEGRDSGRWRPSNTRNPIEERPNATNGRRIKGTDAITLRYLGGTALPLRASMRSRNDSIRVGVNNDWATPIARGDTLAITDCHSADIFIGQLQAKSTNNITHASSISIRRKRRGYLNIPTRNEVNDLSKIYKNDAYVRRFIARRYFIGKSISYTGNSLYRQNSNGVFQELVQGVENLQILYGLDTDNDRLPDRYLTADHSDLRNVKSWNNVVSIKLAILVRTLEEDPYTPLDAGPYTLLDNTVSPPALQVRRQVFNATVQIRNRRTPSLE